MSRKVSKGRVLRKNVVLPLHSLGEIKTEGMRSDLAQVMELAIAWRNYFSLSLHSTPFTLATNILHLRICLLDVYHSLPVDLLKSVENV